MQKRIVLLVCVLVLAFLPLAMAGAADEKKPAADDRPLIYINTNSQIGPLVAVNSGMSEFAQIAEDIGFRVDHGFLTSITDEFLANVSVLVLMDPAFIPLDDDKEAMKRFLRNGGSIIAAHWWSNMTAFDGFIAEFGIGAGLYLNNFSTDGSVAATSPLAKPNSVAKGVTTNYYRQTLINDPTYVINIGNYDTGDSIGVISTHPNIGKGKLLVTGSLALWCNNTVGGFISNADNRAFTKNLISWFYPSCDLSVKKFRWKGGYPGPGDTITTVVVVNNIGQSANTDLWMQYSLEQQNGMGAKPSTVHTWNHLNAQVVVQPGKKVKLKHALKIPVSIEAGDYTLRVVIDSKQVEPDQNRANNTKDATKTLIVQ